MGRLPTFSNSMSSADMSINGLIGIQYQREVRGEWASTELHCVPKAVRLADVLEASFSGYESACRYLCRILKRGLQAR